MSKKEFTGTCPCCETQMQITEYECKKCRIKVNGNFEKSDFLNLDAIQLKFAEIFLKNRGNIKDVEKELGVSYPSVKKMLDNLVGALNGESVKQSKKSVVPKVVDIAKDSLVIISEDEEVEIHLDEDSGEEQ